MSSSTEKEKCNNGDSIQKGLKKRRWSTEDDEILKAYVTKNGEKNWNSVSKNTGLSRDGKSCRLRWLNHLHPDLKKGPLSEEEDKLLVNLRTEFGEKWNKIARQLPGRTDHAIKNHWYGKERKLETKRKRKYEKLGQSPNPQHIKHDSTLFNVPDKKLPKLVDDSNMLYNDVGSTSISNHTAPTSIDVGGIGTSPTPMAMVSYQPIPTMDYQPIPPPDETYQMAESINRYCDRSFEFIYGILNCWECSDATLMRPSEINLVDERGKKPISLENDVEANHDDLMVDERECWECSDATRLGPSEIILVDERGKKPISLGNDVEANHGYSNWFDYDLYDNDNNWYDHGLYDNNNN